MGALVEEENRLASDWLLISKIGVNGTMLYQCNQSEVSWKPVCCKFNFGVNEPLSNNSNLIISDKYTLSYKQAVPLT